jgi:hypothetical protein
MTKDPKRPSSTEDLNEVAEQLRIGLQLMKDHRETFAALARRLPEKQNEEFEARDDSTSEKEDCMRGLQRQRALIDVGAIA